MKSKALAAEVVIDLNDTDPVAISVELFDVVQHGQQQVTVAGDLQCLAGAG